MKSKFKHMVVTHADFDGIASMINVYNIVEYPLSNFQYYVVGYHSIDKILTGLKRDTFDVLWILDIRLTKEQINILKNCTCQRIIWVDHHVYDFDVDVYISECGLNIKFIYDQTISACKATNNFIAKHWKYSASICKEFCDLGDIYDMWRKDDPRFKEAYAINDLYWEYKYEKFFNIFKDGYSLLPEDKAMILHIHNERKAYEEDTIANHLQFNKEYGIAYVLNPKCKHINHISLVYPAKLFVILKEIADNYIAYSIRMYDPDLLLTMQEVFDIIKKSGVIVNTCGGHETIGGIQIPIEENEKFLETINMIFERKLK